MRGQVFGVDRETWQAAFAEHVQEIPVTSYVINKEGPCLRVAFGRDGAPCDDSGGRDSPRYYVAVHLTPDLVLQLAKTMLNMITPPAPATPETQSDQVSDQVADQPAGD